MEKSGRWASGGSTSAQVTARGGLQGIPGTPEHCAWVIRNKSLKAGLRLRDAKPGRGAFSSESIPELPWALLCDHQHSRRMLVSILRGDDNKPGASF